MLMPSLPPKRDINVRMFEKALDLELSVATVVHISTQGTGALDKKMHRTPRLCERGLTTTKNLRAMRLKKVWFYTSIAIECQNCSSSSCERWCISKIFADLFTMSFRIEHLLRVIRKAERKVSNDYTLYSCKWESFLFSKKN
jgi:hypothetical protein